MIKSRHQALLRVSVGRSHGRLSLVGQSEQELSEAALGRSVVAQDWRERGIAQGLGQALAERFTSASIVGEAVKRRISIDWMRAKASEETYRKKQRTTCLSRRTVCWSTN